MKRRSGSRVKGWVYGGSVVLHAALAVTTLALPNEKRAETVAIELAAIKKKAPPPKPPPPPPKPPPPHEKPKPPPPPKSEAKAKIAPEAPKAQAPPPLEVGADGFADLGVSLGGGGDGVAVPVGGGPATASAAAHVAAAAAPRRAVKKVVQELAPAAADVCDEPPARPHRTVPVAPKYTMQAREAEIEGVVRVEVTVDEAGHVVRARVISGLGYGLDESALAAARASVFEPATRCGRPVVGTVILPFRFEST